MSDNNNWDTFVPLSICWMSSNFISNPLHNHCTNIHLCSCTFMKMCPTWCHRGHLNMWCQSVTTVSIRCWQIFDNAISSSRRQQTEGYQWRVFTPQTIEHRYNPSIPMERVWGETLCFSSKCPWAHRRAVPVSCVPACRQRSKQDPLPAGARKAHLKTSILGEMRHRATAWETGELRRSTEMPLHLTYKVFLLNGVVHWGNSRDSC